MTFRQNNHIFTQNVFLSLLWSTTETLEKKISLFH